MEETDLKDTIGDDRAVDANLLDHGRPMLSLAKAYSEDEVRVFYEQVLAHAKDETVRFSIEPKFDGVAVNVVMRRGEMISAATRGNGTRGEDIADQMRVIRGLNYEWAFDPMEPRIEDIELRGEIFMTDETFESLNCERVTAGEEPFRYPSSVAAGAIKLTDLDAVAGRGLSVVFHGWGDVKPANAAPRSVKVFQR